jgi:hypothetical protein
MVQSQAPVSIRAYRHYERRPGSQRPPVSVHCGWQWCVPPAGIEPATSTLGTSRSPPLSYEGVTVVDRRGVEPRPSGLQSETVHQHPAHVNVRTPAGTRTRTVGVLNTVPLPLGHEGVYYKSGPRGSNPHFLVGSQALYH